VNFYSFAIISPWERGCPSFVQFWIPFAQGCFVPSLVKIGPVVLEKKIFKWPHPIFGLWLFPLWKGPGPWFVQFWIPFTKGWFVPSLIEIGLLVLKKIFKSFQWIFTLSLLSPLGEGGCLSFVHFWIPFAQGCFVPSLIKIGPAVLKKKSKM
jgi:hypothetical protein